MMKYLLSVVALFASVMLFAQPENPQTRDWALFIRHKKVNAEVPRGAKAVFMGNSITESWGNRPFFADNGYIGRGISGQTSSQMLVRFRADVLELQPKCVVIMAGTNDIARNNGVIELENILGNIISMSELAQLHKIKVILCSTPPAAEFRWNPGIEPADDIIRLNAMVKEYADKNKITYVDYHSAIKDERNGLPEKYSADGVHPNAECYLIMESIIKPIIDKVAN